MSAGLVVVLVVGLVILSSYIARRQGYSHNQRVVLSAIAIGLLLWNLYSRGSVDSVVLAVAGIVVLVFGVLFIRKSQR